jgi:hypothetical protein
MVKSYVKRPIPIEAIQWNGKNFDEIKAFCKDAMIAHDGELIIPTLEDGKFIKAKHVATEGDYVIKGVRGEFYFCKEDIFNETYEEVEFCN